MKSVYDRMKNRAKAHSHKSTKVERLLIFALPLLMALDMTLTNYLKIDRVSRMAFGYAVHART
jgi:hypothetical protein